MRVEKRIVSYDEAKKYLENINEAGLKQGQMYVNIFYKDDGSIDEERTYRSEYRSKTEQNNIRKDEKDAKSDRKKMKKNLKKGGPGSCSICTSLFGGLSGLLGIDTDSIPFLDNISDVNDKISDVNDKISDISDNI